MPVLLASMALLGIAYYTSASKSFFSLQKQEMSNIVQAAIHSLDNFIDSCQREVAMFSEMSALKDACKGARIEETQKLLATYQKQNPSYEAIFIANETGKIFMDSADGKMLNIEMSIDENYRANFEKAQRGETCVSDIVKSSLSSSPIIYVTAPMSADGKTAGIVGIVAKIESFDKTFLSDIKIGSNGYVVLINKKGLVATYPEKDNVLKLNLNEYDFGRKMFAQKRGFIEYTFSKENKMAQFETDEKTGWTIMGIAIEKEFLTPLRKLKYISITMGFPILILMSAILWIITGKASSVIRQSVKNLFQIGEQVTAGSVQVSETSQSLADGASKQAASIQEICSSLEEMSSMTRQNAENARVAKNLADETRKAADSGTSDMKQMKVAMDEIKKSSDDVSKIIKTIDEIAFQTNILALNAAVEAARAGEAGMGFAVVADEVRALAQRSSHAAKETADRIRSAVEKSDRGVQISSDMETTLQEMVEKARKVDELISEISRASNEQSIGISQVNNAIAEMDQVTQTTAAHAEESASSAEQLSAQAQEMGNAIQKILTVVEGETFQEKPAPSKTSSPLSKSAPSPKNTPSKMTLAQKAKTIIPLEDDFKDF